MEVKDSIRVKVDTVLKGIIPICYGIPMLDTRITCDGSVVA